ncbi:MAG: hypothetical protein Q8K32_07695 [Archangium sp.]|nr:hypothetical protein [Archangium sp.]
MNATPRLLCGLCLSVIAWSCTPPCESISSNPQTVCHRADAGTIAADAPFVIEGETYASGTCSVTVEGGQINLAVDGMSCSRSDSERAAPAAPRFVKCTVPALPAGTYTIKTGTPVTFTIPESADAGVPRCP